MPDSALLARQRALVRTLAEPKAIDAGAIPEALAGIDSAGMRLMSAMSLSKRIEKIRALAPRTFLLIGHERLEALAEDFASAAPPDSALRLDNADQFQDFMETFWETEPPEPPFLLDLLAYELADARARLWQVDHQVVDAPPVSRPAFRMKPGSAVVTLEYDVRTIAAAEIGAPFEPPPPRPTTLLLVPADDGGLPRVFELNPALLAVLPFDGAWTPFDADDDDRTGLLDRLEGLGIAEVAR